MLVEEIKTKDNHTLKIYTDDYAESPREWDNLAQFVCFHKRYDLGDKHDIDHNDYESWEEMIEANTKEGDIVEPLYLLDHGSITISTSPFMCPWDSGRIGYAVVTKEAIIECYGDDSPESRSRALRCLEAEVETYDHYLQGSVYGFELYDENDVLLDSCFGFYGYDNEKNGIFDHAGIKKEDIA